ncbi:hypothetical protein [Vibrio sp. 10N.261.46.A3]|uniref:hypothetical protein n=1 Tax=Vibrio sp. 10N.261.46.A3 TaxID=3229658 RepID=UPI00354D1A63
MSKYLATSGKSINKTDVASSATLTSVATFVLLTWSKTLTEESVFTHYVSEQTIAFSAGLISFSMTILLSYLRYKVRMINHKREYTDKVEFLDGLKAATSCEETKTKLEQQKNEILLAKASAVANERCD